MGYILGALNLLNPKSFSREFVETSAENLSILGKTTRRVENRKEKFTLVYQNLTLAQANSILAEYDLDEARLFESTETDLTIAATLVLIDVSTRNYPLTGAEYRQDLTLVLTEII